MNTSWKVHFKIVGIYVLSLSLWSLINLLLSSVFTQDHIQPISVHPIFSISIALAYLAYLFAPSLITGLLYHRCTKIYPDSGSRRTSNILLSFVGIFVPLLIGDYQVYRNPNLFGDPEVIAIILFLLAFHYLLNLLLVSVGLSIGLRFTRKKFVN